MAIEWKVTKRNSKKEPAHFEARVAGLFVRIKRGQADNAGFWMVECPMFEPQEFKCGPIEQSIDQARVAALAIIEKRARLIVNECAGIRHRRLRSVRTRGEG